MNEKVCQKLGELIAQYGFSLCDDVKRLEMLLENSFGKNNKEVAILITALKNQVAKDLINASPSVLKYALCKRLVKRLQDSLHSNEKTAQWIVESWALALGVLEKPIFLLSKRNHLNNKVSGAKEEIKTYQTNNRNSFNLKIASVVFILVIFIFGWIYIQDNKRLTEKDSQQRIQEVQYLAEEATQRKILEAQRLADQEAQRKAKEAKEAKEAEEAAQRKILEAQRLADQEAQRKAEEAKEAKEAEEATQRKILEAQRLADQEAQRKAEEAKEAEEARKRKKKHNVKLGKLKKIPPKAIQSNDVPEKKSNNLENSQNQTCPNGQICVDYKSNQQMNMQPQQEQKQIYSQQKEIPSILRRKRNYRVVCPTSFFCYPQEL